MKYHYSRSEDKDNAIHVARFHFLFCLQSESEGSLLFFVLISLKATQKNHQKR